MRVLIFLLLTYVSVSVFCQNGIVVDAVTQKPIQGASVYVDGSTYGTSTNEKGLFSLKGFPNPPFQISVSTVGYYSGKLIVTKDNSSSLTILLKPKVVEMDNVIVRKPVKDGWKKYGNIFLEQFIGYSAFASKCILKNKKDVVFFYDKDNDIISATAYDPLIIINEALGYRLTYWLDEFSLEHSMGKLYYVGNVQFTDLLDTRTGKHKKKVWLRNRDVAYNGSLQHFLSCVYAGHHTTDSSGFIVRPFKRINQNSYLNSLPCFYDSINTNMDSSKRVFNEIKALINKSLPRQYYTDVLELYKSGFEAWYKDTLIQRAFVIKLTTPNSLYLFQCTLFKDVAIHSVIRAKFAEAKFDITQKWLSQTFSILGSQIVNTDSILKPTGADEKVMAFSQGLFIIYKNEAEEKEYVQRAGNSNFFPSMQKSILWLNNIPGIVIYANGYYMPPNGIFVENYWAYEKIDKLLPSDFKKVQ